MTDKNFFNIADEAYTGLRLTMGIPFWLPMMPAGISIIHFEYTNHRGEISQRRVVPSAVHHRATQWHPEPQWLLFGVDLDKGEPRSFAMKDMRGMQYEPSARI